MGAVDLFIFVWREAYWVSLSTLFSQCFWQDPIRWVPSSPLYFKEFFRFVKWPCGHCFFFTDFMWTLLRSFRWWPTHSEYERKSIIFHSLNFPGSGAYHNKTPGQRWVCQNKISKGLNILNSGSLICRASFLTMRRLTLNWSFRMFVIHPRRN